MTLSTESIPRQYVELALALERHIPGYIDAYFGPPEWKTASLSGDPRPIEELIEATAALATTIEQDATLDAQRRDFLSRHVTAMQTSLRLLQGEALSLTDETTLLYDIKPAWIDEREFEDIHRQLDELLPPGESLYDRLQERKRRVEISYAQAEPILNTITTRLRQLTRERFPLPDSESFQLFPVDHKPWSAYNWYLGGGRSRIEMNTDLPLQITMLARTIAHEGYAGHHTELSIKDIRLLQSQGWLEHCLALINAPSCVISEGIAVRALDILMSEEEQIQWHADEIFPLAGRSSLDAAREHAISKASLSLGDVWDNAAFLLHDQHLSPAEVSAYFRRYGLRRIDEAEKAVEFLSAPLSRSYVFTYSYGGKLLDALFAAKGNAQSWFTRLLTEAVTPGQIRQWIGA